MFSELLVTFHYNLLNLSVLEGTSIHISAVIVPYALDHKYVSPYKYVISIDVSLESDGVIHIILIHGIWFSCPRLKQCVFNATR